MNDNEAMQVTEVLLFAAGDPLLLSDLCLITGLSDERQRMILEQLNLKYRRDCQSSLSLRELDGAFALSVRPGFNEHLAQLFRPKHYPALSPAAYETLAAVAYNQPVTRAQVEAVRGVNSDSLISRLQDRGYLEQCGSLDAPGRPALFEVSRTFLLDFGLSSASDLPALDLLNYETIQKLSEM